MVAVWLLQFSCGQLEPGTAQERESGTCSSTLAKLIPQHSTLLFIFMFFLKASPENVLSTWDRGGESTWDSSREQRWGYPVKRRQQLSLSIRPHTYYWRWDSTSRVRLLRQLSLWAKTVSLIPSGSLRQGYKRMKFWREESFSQYFLSNL